MTCPNVTSIQLQMSATNFKHVENQTSFLYVVKTCPAMNEIRQNVLKTDPVECASDAEILAAAD